MNKKAVVCIALLCICIGIFAGCGKENTNTKVVLTTGFDRDEVFRIDRVSCSEAELMVYLTNTQNQYENVFGQEIWAQDFDGTTLEENIKETVLARIARIKAMTLLAKQHEIALNEEEIGLANEAAKEYFNSLNDREIELLDVSLDEISTMYQEYALANKVYSYIIRDINPEISDDEARTITVEHILIRTYTLDADGKRVPMSESEKQSAFDRAKEVCDRLAAGEDFVTLMELYNEDSVNTYSIRQGEMEPAFEEAAFFLDSGAISEIVETSYGYEIIRCVSTFDREQTDINKLVIVQKRREEVFEAQYEEFVATLTKQLNESLWNEIAFIHDEEVTTTDFFVIYGNYFTEDMFVFEPES